MGARLQGSGASRSLPSTETAKLFLLNTISKSSPPRTIARPMRSVEDFATGRPPAPAVHLQKPDKQLSPGQHPSTNFLPLAIKFFFHVISRDLSLTLVQRSYELRHALVRVAPYARTSCAMRSSRDSAMNLTYSSSRSLAPIAPTRPITRRPNSALPPMNA